eukprot:30903-Pelagococcus_subviridis.AAC.14
MRFARMRRRLASTRRAAAAASADGRAAHAAASRFPHRRDTSLEEPCSFASIVLSRITSHAPLLPPAPPPTTLSSSPAGSANAGMPTGTS